MAAPARQEYVPNPGGAEPNNQFLQAPGAAQGNYPQNQDARDNSAHRLNNNNSRGSLNGSGSAQKLLEAKHLGPTKMKEKVGTAVAYNQWNPSPLPHAYQAP